MLCASLIHGFSKNRAGSGEQEWGYLGLFDSGDVRSREAGLLQPRHHRGRILVLHDADAVQDVCYGVRADPATIPSSLLLGNFHALLREAGTHNNRVSKP